MKMWLTTTEIAQAALLGMPSDRASIIRLAEREGWASRTALARKRAGRGGGMEYHIDLLPVAARVAYLSGQSAADLADAGDSAVQAAPDLFEAASAAAGRAFDARVAILGAFRAFERAGALKRVVAVGYFRDLYNLGKVDLAPWVREQVPGLSTRTLLRWLSAQRDGEIQRLAVDKGAARRGQGVLDIGNGGAIKGFVLALLAHNSMYTGRQLHETVCANYPVIDVKGQQKSMPGLRAFEIALKRWKSEYRNELQALTNPDAYVSRTRVAGSYAHLVTRLNALWQIDASPVDALCTDGRHSIYICVDVWSRRICLLVSKTPRSEAVQLLMRKAILAWGVPAEVKTDNGSDFIARATKRLFAGLGIEAITSQAFSPWQKGVVERAVREYQRDCGRMLPGFIGHSVADRKVIEQRRAFAARLGTDDARAFAVELSAADLQLASDRWANEIHAQHAHGGIGGETPFARAASWREPVRRLDEEALAVLLMQAPDGDGRRMVGKSGIRVDGFHYLAPGLTVGERVFVRLDPADKGRIWCFDEAGERFLGIGTCPEIAGVDPAALRAEVAAVQKRLLEERTAEIKAERRKITPRTVMDSRFQLAAQQSGNLVAFPPRSERHTTPSLDEALQVASLRKGGAPVPAPLREGDRRIMAEIEAEAALQLAPTVKVRPLRESETPQQRFRRYREFRARVEAGEVLGREDAAWLFGYAESAECKGMTTVFEDFGEAGVV